MQEQLIERASLLFEQKRYAEAQKVLMEILALSPNNVQSIVLLVEIKIHNETWNEAIELIENAIAIDPEFDVLFYLKAKIYFLQNKTDLSIQNLKIAIGIDPYEANNFAFLGHVLLHKKQFSEALNNANQALEIDATHIFALNVRSTALLKLNLKTDAFETIEDALNEDPNNAFTHANYGWGLLEKGNNDKALEHFSESLKNNPNSEYAQAGMAEALKSKYWIYRWFLKYSFWMNNLTSKNQWAFIIGFYIISRILRKIAHASPSLAPFLIPVIVLLAIFALSTWIINPLTNLLFSLNKFGKHLLSKEEKKSALFVGLSVGIMFIGLIFYLITQQELGIFLTVFGFTMMLPSGRFYEQPKMFFKIYPFVLLILAILAVIQASITGEMFNTFVMIYLFGIFGYQWVANFFAIKSN